MLHVFDVIGDSLDFPLVMLACFIMRVSNLPGIVMRFPAILTHRIFLSAEGLPMNVDGISGVFTGGWAFDSTVIPEIGCKYRGVDLSKWESEDGRPKTEHRSGNRGGGGVRPIALGILS